MFGIKRRFQRCKVWPPRFKEASIRLAERDTSASNLGTPLKTCDFCYLSTNLAREWLQIDTDLLRCPNKHCWRAFRGYQHRWPWMTLNPQNMGFKWMFRYFRLWRTLKKSELICSRDNLRTKLNWCCRASREHISSDFLSCNLGDWRLDACFVTRAMLDIPWYSIRHWCIRASARTCWVMTSRVKCLVLVNRDCELSM